VGTYSNAVMQINGYGDRQTRAVVCRGNEPRARKEDRDGLPFVETIVGRRSLRAVLDQVEAVAGTNTTVLITGETGTGKEVIARAIHELSPRRNKNLVKVNCAAMPAGLLESELFGHERGAFTGAVNSHVGRFALADRGTLFLDEIGDTPLELQPKLLRVLQEREFEAVGSTRTTRVDIRVVAATNQHLQQMVRNRTFREDLYYRLHVFPIDLPPLRERKADIPELVEYFVQQFATSMDKTIETIPEETMRSLVRHSWPGNIRELQNYIARGVILSNDGVFELASLERCDSPEPEISNPTVEDRVRSKILNGLSQHPPLTTETKNQIELPRRLMAQEKKMIEEALKESRGRVLGVTGAAAKLGIPRSTLESKIRSLKIDKNRFRTLSEI
jgi:formate hydrogenlyase transcriptional activator